jgi:hypothetical protein
MADDDILYLVAYGTKTRGTDLDPFGDRIIYFPLRVLVRNVDYATLPVLCTVRYTDQTCRYVDRGDEKKEGPMTLVRILSALPSNTPLEITRYVASFSDA